MSTLDKTVSMLELLPEDKLVIIYNMTKKYFDDSTASDTIKPKSEEEILEELQKTREDAAEGKVQDASSVSLELRTKYGL